MIPFALASLALLPCAGPATVGELAPPLPDSVVDLSQADSLALVGGRWSWLEASLVEVDFPTAGPDKKPSGPIGRTHDLQPRGDQPDLAGAAWQPIAPTELELRRSSGLHAQGWYRLQLRLPERLGELEVAGTTAVLELVVDDYAEVWVDGELPLVLGSTPALARGWNAPNRVVLTLSAEPGETHDLWVFAANAPLSAPPRNYVWIRSATLDLYRPGRWNPAEKVALEVERFSPRLDEVLGETPVLERVASGFQFTEGPVWSSEGYLLFSDPNANTIYRWSPADGTSVWRAKSGYKGLDIARLRQSGSNGLAFDGEGRLVICEHGNRRLTRLEKNGSLTVLAERYQGKRLNSPNDVTVAADGAIYFSDPPFGLPAFHADPARELDYCGVFRWKAGELSLIDGSLQGPNGVALSPDQSTLYVGNWDPQRKVVLRYDLRPDGSVSEGRLFCDLTSRAGEEAIDGIEVDAAGHLFISGPGGTWIYASTGELLGRLQGPEQPANFAFGGADGQSLFLAARSGLYRLRTRTGAPGS